MVRCDIDYCRDLLPFELGWWTFHECKLQTYSGTWSNDNASANLNSPIRIRQSSERWATVPSASPKSLREAPNIRPLWTDYPKFHYGFFNPGNFKFPDGNFPGVQWKFFPPSLRIICSFSVHCERQRRICLDTIQQIPIHSAPQWTETSIWFRKEGERTFNWTPGKFPSGNLKLPGWKTRSGI